MMSKTTNNAAMMKSETLWNVKDRWSDVKAERIFTPKGEPTRFAMVYAREAGSKDEYEAMRPVSEKYTPVCTQDLVNTAVERLGGKLLDEKNPRVRTARNGSFVSVSMPLSEPLKVDVPAFDSGHPWVRFGQAVKGKDILYPTVHLTNSYDKSSQLIVDVGLYRLICANGMKTMAVGFSARAFHRVKEVERILGELRSSKQIIDLSTIRKFVAAKLDDEQIKHLLEELPVRKRDEFRDYMKLGRDSVWSAMNGLSYLSTHEFSLQRGKKVNRLSRWLQQVALNN